MREIRKIFRFYSFCTIFFFVWSILWTNSPVSDEKDFFDSTKELYKNREYDKAILNLNELIDNFFYKIEKKEFLIEAYYLLAKINFELRDDAKMEEILFNIFLLEPDYPIVETTPTFRQIIERIKTDKIVEGKRFYRLGEYGKAISVLEEFIVKNQNTEKRNFLLAFAYYLLAKIYFDTRYESKINLNLKKLFEADPSFRINEIDLAFKFRLDSIRNETIKINDSREKERTSNKVESITMNSEIPEKKSGKETEKLNVIEQQSNGNKIKSKKKFPWLIAGGIVIAAAILTTILIKKGKKSSENSQFGGIQITSNPSGAQVFLDGNGYGKATPCTITNYPIGIHELKLIHSSCVPWEGKIEVKPNLITNVSIDLTLIVQLISKWGSEGSGDNQFYMPFGIAVDNQDYVYVADSYNDRVMKFTSNGTFIAKWGNYNDENYSFYIPVGIAVDSANNVYLADTWHHNIKKFTSNGIFIKKWGLGCSGSYYYVFNEPQGVAIDKTNNLYVADTEKSRVVKFTTEWKYLLKWDYGSFCEGIATDNFNNVYATGGGRVKKFTPSGNLITSWDSPGSFGIATDTYGNVYVSDYYNNKVSIYSESGKLLFYWGTKGNGDYQFSSPAGIAIDRSNNIYVVDCLNNRIMKFRFNNNNSQIIKVGFTEYLPNKSAKFPPTIRKGLGNQYIKNNKEDN